MGHRGRSIAFVATTTTTTQGNDNDNDSDISIDESVTTTTTVAEVAGAIIASTGRGRMASVQSIAVAPGYRRMGVASRLLRAVADECHRNRQIDSLQLQVSKNNLPARRLYERLGFILKNELRGYYHASDGPDSGDALVMIAKLPLVDR